MELLNDIIKKDGVARGGWRFDNYYFILSEENKAPHLPGNLLFLNNYYRYPEKQGILKYFANTSEVTIIEHHWTRVGIE